MVWSVLWVCVIASTSMSVLFGTSCVLPVMVGGGKCEFPSSLSVSIQLWLFGRDDVWARGVVVSLSAVGDVKLAGLRSVGCLGR